MRTTVVTLIPNKSSMSPNLIKTLSSSGSSPSLIRTKTAKSHLESSYQVNSWLIWGLAALYGTDEERKLEFAFKIYDIDEDGYITNGELFTVLKMMVGNNLTDLQLQQLVDRTIIKADLVILGLWKDYDGKISYPEFKNMVKDLDIGGKLKINKIWCMELYLAGIFFNALLHEFLFDLQYKWLIEKYKSYICLSSYFIFTYDVRTSWSGTNHNRIRKVSFSGSSLTSSSLSQTHWTFSE